MNPISYGRVALGPIPRSPVVVRDGRGPAVRGAGPTGPGGEAALSLDQEENKSPRGGPEKVTDEDAVVIPVYSGGKLDFRGGMASRLRDLAKFQHLGLTMKLPVFLTLTLDRNRFESEEQAYDQTKRWLSRLLSERLGIKLWGRTCEVQTDSGEGWIHWHVLMDAGDTCYDATSAKGRPWINLKRLRADVMRYWCHEWKFGGEASQDIQPVRKRQAVAGYLSKYVAKPWPAVPQWVLRRKMIRIVGFSLAANRILRDAELLPERKPPRVARKRRRQPVGPLIDRMAASGLTSKVIQGRRWLGTLRGTEGGVMFASIYGYEVRRKVRVFETAISVATQTVAVLTDATTRGLASINAWLEHVGITEYCDTTFQLRRAEIWGSWSRMQVLAG